MILMLEAIHGQVVLGVGTPLGWAVREDPIDWMLDMMFINFLMLRKRQYQMRCKYQDNYCVCTLYYTVG